MTAARLSRGLAVRRLATWGLEDPGSLARSAVEHAVALASMPSHVAGIGAREPQSGCTLDVAR